MNCEFKNKTQKQIHNSRPDPKGRGRLDMPDIKIRKGESIDSALRRFKRECEREGILTEIKKREHYEKPSEKRKRLAQQSEKRIRRMKMKMRMFSNRGRRSSR